MLLSRAERRADRGSATPPLEQMRRLARRYRSELFSCVWDIAPVSALAAALARTGRVDATVAAEVSSLAATSGVERRRLLVSDTHLRGGLAARGLPALSALCDAGLGAYEAGALLAAADAGHTSAAELAAALEAASGMAAVDDLMRRTFAERGEIILVDAALADLERQSYRLRQALLRQAASRLRARCEAFRSAHPELQDLVDARTAVDPAARLEPEEQAELAALFGGAVRRPSADEAAGRALAWLARANAPHTTPLQRALAMRAHVRYAALLRATEPREDGAG
jgi:hypothetical protein